MEDIVKMAVKYSRVWEQTMEDAEEAAEVYVSSTLGLSDEDESKRIIKSQYIDMFMEEIRKII